MIKVNKNFNALKENYLFKEVADRVAAYKAKNGDNGLIALGIGDVTLPLAKIIAEKFSRAAKDMGSPEGFHGYAPYFGYDFLRCAVNIRYKERGVTLSEDEIFISDGAKCDIANLTDLFENAVVLIPTPAYPAYADVNVIAGNRVIYLDLNEEDGFLPKPENLDKNAYLIYLCSPNNPTGIVYSATLIKSWVDFALETGSLIIFDGAYCEYITEAAPHSVFEVEGAKYCAIEVCSMSKSAGFTGVRCGWVVVPKELNLGGVSVNKIWQRRQSTKFNGVSYPVQVAAEAALSDEGRNECRKQIEYYLENAKILHEFCQNKGLKCFGGKSSPYIWLKCPRGFDGWCFFDYLLNNAGVICTPGEGFGTAGRGYVRLTSFNTRPNTLAAVERFNTIM